MYNKIVKAEMNVRLQMNIATPPNNTHKITHSKMMMKTLGPVLSFPGAATRLSTLPGKTSL